MRTDVKEVPYGEMSPELRALITYESNGSLDLAEPQGVMERILRETPVIVWEAGVAFFTMADVVAAARNPSIVSVDPATGTPQGMGSAEPLIPLHFDGDIHREYRKLLDPLFTPRKMAELEPDIRKLADELIDGFAPAGQAELHEQFCVPLPSIVFLTLFGMPLEDMDQLIAFKDGILRNRGVTMEEKEALGRAAGKEMHVFLRAQLKERKKSGSRFGDLLDSFLHFELDGRRFTDDELINIMHMFLVAGLDTVTSSSSLILAWLASHQVERHRILEDASLLAPAIEDIMRIESPVPYGGARWAAEDTEVNGVPVRRGQMVFLCWATANVDPSQFMSPLAVDMERSENRHVAFAAGFHRCLGSHLARNELRTAIDQFHRRVQDYWVTEGDAIKYELVSVRQATRLPVSFTVA